MENENLTAIDVEEKTTPGQQEDSLESEEIAEETAESQDEPVEEILETQDIASAEVPVLVVEPGPEKDKTLGIQIESHTNGSTVRSSKIKIISIEKDPRTVRSITEKRKESDNCCRSMDAQFLLGDPKLFVEPEAVEQILTFTHWGEETQENDVEQAALIYGRLCEYKSDLGVTKRWGEVCGIIQAEPELATSLSIKISADEWKRMNIALDEINHQAETKGEETFVSLGWMHTHPHQLDPFFSSVDIKLQQSIMDNDDLFGLVVNPHRQIFSCFKDGNSKPCKAVFELTEDLTNRWSFVERAKKGKATEEKEQGMSSPKGDREVLVMKSKRSNRLIPITHCTISQFGEVVNPRHFPVDQMHAIPVESFSTIVHTLRQTYHPADAVAVVILEADFRMNLIAIIPKAYFGRLRTAMDREWHDYCYATMLYNGGELDSIRTMASLAQLWQQHGLYTNTRFTSIMLLNDTTMQAYMISKGQHTGGN